jgi:hypothetical protein
MRSADTATSVLRFQILGCGVRILCPQVTVAPLLAANWSTLAVGGLPASPVGLDYSIVRSRDPDSFEIRRNDDLRIPACGTSDLLFRLEKDITIELQRRRPELLFLHAAALDFEGQATLLVAASGSGKSTTAWALLHHGFGYMSDELAPVDLVSMTVRAYPHALCLKTDPPGPYPLPAATLRTSRTLHVPTTALPRPPLSGSCPIQAIFFLVANEGPSGARPLGSAEAATRLYVNALNQLAHPAAGLDAAIAVARKARCFELHRSDLAAMTAAVRTAVASLPAA